MTYRRHESQNLPCRCPHCGDDLQLIHRHPGPAVHVVQCANPGCSYERPYDSVLHTELERHRQQLAFVTAQMAWLTIQVEELFARVAEGAAR
jgi:hypothetical protein